MTVGKNTKKAKKGNKKKPVDPMSRKEWYDVIAPAVFTKRQCSKTFANKTVGNKVGSENLKGRVVDINLGDLMVEEQSDYAHRKIKIKIEDVQGRNCLTSFYGMDMTRDRLCSLIKKWCSLIEDVIDVKTTDGYVLRIFVIAFTNRRTNHVKKNCYAQTSQIRRIRAKMTEIVTRTVQKNSLLENVKKFQLEVMGQEIQKACNGIYPLRDVSIRKVKVLKAPKFDMGKLMDAHGENIPTSREEVGAPAE